LSLIAAPAAMWAQATPDLNAKLAADGSRHQSRAKRRRNAWMLVSSALVLMMTAPGLALFYGGLVRRKNVLGTMMHSFILMAVVTIIWAVAGYTLAFGGILPYIGNLQYAFLDGVGSTPNTDYAGTIPHATFMVYQLMFAIITPGAHLRGLRRTHEVQRHAPLHSPLDVHRLLFPMAHMVWGKGGLLNAFSGGSIPCFDFAGGTVVPYHQRRTPPWSARSISVSGSDSPVMP
jgi:Amt family ammonium transporter